MAFLMLVMAYGVPFAWADSPSTNVTLVQVAYLYNFAKFIEWPPEALTDEHAAFTLCMLGTDASEGALPSLRGKTIKGKKVAIKYFTQAADLNPEACHILFISMSKRDRLHQILVPFAEQPVLTVGDKEWFARSGGMISFITIRNKTRFAINVEAAQRAGLHIRSKLLKLAEVVQAGG
jgi:hypothetical protein